MDLRFTEEEIAFRQEVRAFVRAELPASIRRKIVAGRHPSKDDMVRWTRLLAAKGWSVPHWPVEWGGTGWSAMQAADLRRRTAEGQRRRSRWSSAPAWSGR